MSAKWPEPLQFGPWLLVQRLAVSAMSEVWVGQLLSDGRPCAIKRVLPIYREDQQLRALFRREIKCLREIDDRRLPRFLCDGEANGVPWLAMPYWPGASLLALLAAGPLPPDAARWLASELAEALRAVHRAGLVHADVSPDNVHVRTDGQLLLLDFGIAVPQGQATPTRRGKARYASPEQLAGAPLTADTDWYAFGKIREELRLRDADPQAGEADPTAAMAVLRDRVAQVKPPREGQVWQAAELRGEAVTDPGLDEGATSARP